MTKKPCSLAMIGGSHTSAAGRAHFTACRMDHLWSVDAGCFSRNPETNRAAGDYYGISQDRLYPSLDALLESEKDRLDAVAILTPTPDHKDMVISSLRAGVPVICEKALSMDTAEAVEIAKVNDELKGFLAVIYNYSGYPMVRELRRMIRDGELGDLLHFQAEMPQEGYLRVDKQGNKMIPQEWRQKDGEIPTLHLDLAVHLHHLVYYLTEQRPTEVVSDHASRGDLGVVDNALALCRYTGGIQGQYWFSKCSLGHRNGLRIRLYGTKGSAEWYQANPEEVVISKATGERIIQDRAVNAPVAAEDRYSRFKVGHPAGFIEALSNLYADIHTALTQYKETGVYESDHVFGTEHSIDGLQWLDAMIRSFDTGKWEPVS